MLPCSTSSTIAKPPISHSHSGTAAPCEFEFLWQISVAAQLSWILRVDALVMEPFSKDDPLHHLLNKTRSVEPRANFTQNVMHTIRNTPQEQNHGWLHTLFASLGIGSQVRPLMIAAPSLAALAIVALILSLNFNASPPVGDAAVIETSPTSIQTQIAQIDNSSIAIAVENHSGPNHLSPDTNTASTDVSAPEESLVVTELDTIDQLSMLLSSQDTSSLTDGELAMLLY